MERWNIAGCISFRLKISLFQFAWPDWELNLVDWWICPLGIKNSNKHSIVRKSKLYDLHQAFTRVHSAATYFINYNWIEMVHFLLHFLCALINFKCTLYNVVKSKCTPPIRYFKIKTTISMNLKHFIWTQLHMIQWKMQKKSLSNKFNCCRSEPPPNNGWLYLSNAHAPIVWKKEGKNNRFQRKSQQQAGLGVKIHTFCIRERHREWEKEVSMILFHSKAYD